MSDRPHVAVALDVNSTVQEEWEHSDSKPGNYATPKDPLTGTLHAPTSSAFGPWNPGSRWKAALIGCGIALDSSGGVDHGDSKNESIRRDRLGASPL